MTEGWRGKTGARHLADGGVAVVLSGAGARGAYEAGVLSVILPALRPYRPRWYFGTSVGAINAVGLAARAHDDPEAAGEHLIRQWRTVRRHDVFRSPLLTFLTAAARRLRPTGRGRPRPVGLLDTSPLHGTLRRLVNWDQLHANLRGGIIDGCGVVATNRSNRDIRVFHECAAATALPDDDEIRRIVFERARLTPAHVIGSAAIPALFPAVAVPDATDDVGWCVDGGVRLNTPIKPAIMLGARRVVVVATTPAAAPVPGDGASRPPGVAPPPPGVAGGLVDVLRAVTDDRMVEDLRTLASDNRALARDPACPTCRRLEAPCSCNHRKRRIDWVFAGPGPAPYDQLGKLARDILRARRYRLSPGRLATRSPDMAQLASFLLFDGDFIDGAIELGRNDAVAQLKDDRVVWKTDERPDTP